MKKIFTLAAIAAVIGSMSLVSCGGSSPEDVAKAELALEKTELEATKALLEKADGSKEEYVKLCLEAEKARKAYKDEHKDDNKELKDEVDKLKDALK